jgi:hypothetical protein
LHIGYHKTATTWFQSQLFSRPELEFRQLGERNLVHQAFCIPHPLEAAGESGIQRILAEAQEATAAGRYFVISHERLSGYPASGGYDSRLIADRLKRHFPNARIFCLFREQRAMILSAWRQQVVDGGGLSLRHFIDSPEPHIRRVPLFDPAMYRYSLLLGHYCALFGAGHVQFHPYEAFCAQPALTLTGLAELLDHAKLRRAATALAKSTATPNRSLSTPVLHCQRFMNTHFARTQLSQTCVVDLGAENIRGAARALDRALGRLLRPLDARARQRGARRIKVRFDSYYDEDNARLAKLIGLPLADYGYSVRPEEA